MTFMTARSVFEEAPIERSLASLGDDTEQTTTVPDRLETDTKDKTSRARNILRRLLPFV